MLIILLIIFLVIIGAFFSSSDDGKFMILSALGFAAILVVAALPYLIAGAVILAILHYALHLF